MEADKFLQHLGDLAIGCLPPPELTNELEVRFEL
jgi:hypothetical protein